MKLLVSTPHFRLKRLCGINIDNALVVLILILIGVRYLQNFVFSFEKGWMVKLLLRFPSTDKIIPPEKLGGWGVSGCFPCKKKILNKTIEKKVCQNMLFSDKLCFVETFELIYIANHLVGFVLSIAEGYFQMDLHLK